MSVYIVNQLSATKYTNYESYKSRLHLALKISFTMNLDIQYDLQNGHKLIMIVDDINLPLNTNNYLYGLAD